MVRWRSVSSSKKQATGQEEMAASCVMKGLDWILEEISSLEELPSIETGCSGRW